MLEQNFLTECRQNSLDSIFNQLIHQLSHGLIAPSQFWVTLDLGLLVFYGPAQGAP